MASHTVSDLKISWKNAISNKFWKDISKTEKLNISENKIKPIVLGVVYAVYLRMPFVPLHSCIGNWTRKETHSFKGIAGYQIEA